MREALVEHAEHDIDRDQRRDDQHQLRPDGIAEARASPAKSACSVSGMCISATASVDARGRRLERVAGARLKLMRDRRKLALVVDRPAAAGAFDLGHRRSGTCVLSAPAT